MNVNDNDDDNDTTGKARGVCDKSEDDQGRYNIVFFPRDSGRTVKQVFLNIFICVAVFFSSAHLGITDMHAQVSPYIAHVYEFVPAPGQFTNSIPEYEEEDTMDDMVRKVEEQLVGKTNGMISLGAWGGYVTFGFDHPLVNVPGEKDLLVYGNAFVKNGEQPEGYTLGSSEPGIVYVSRDENENGQPDDTWYEIAGSETAKANRTYEVTYTNTGKGHIPWTDNQGGKGVVSRNPWHTQASYFPLWRKDEKTAVYTGTLLPPNVYEDNSAYMFDYGYVDNWPNSDERARINLDWAIDAEGNAANLTHVDFIRVMTGVMVKGSQTGDASTEVCGAEDLHPEAEMSTGIQSAEYKVQSAKCVVNGQIVIEKNGERYTILGTKIN